MARKRKKISPGKSEQIKRITYYEDILRKAEQLLREEKDDAYLYAELTPGIRELDAYYGSEEWRRDFEDDEAGLLPQDLPRGVLSEDGIFNVLTAYREIENTLFKIF